MSHPRCPENCRKRKCRDCQNREILGESNVPSWRVSYDGCEEQEHGDNHDPRKGMHFPPYQVAPQVERVIKGKRGNAHGRANEAS